MKAVVGVCVGDGGGGNEREIWSAGETEDRQGQERRAGRDEMRR